MSLKNIDRDSFLIRNQLTSTILNFASTSNKVETDTVVYDGYASTRSTTTAVTTTTSSFKYLGVNLSMQDEEPNPFRIKAYIPGEAILAIGYADATIVAEGNINEAFLFHFTNKFDDIVMLPTKHSGYEDRAIVVGVSPYNVTSAVIRANLSVQNLGVSPLQFAKSTS